VARLRRPSLDRQSEDFEVVSANVSPPNQPSLVLVGIAGAMIAGLIGFVLIGGFLADHHK
jgi:hypothetical protein